MTAYKYRSRYCHFVVKLGICPFRGHEINAKLLCLSGGRYVEL